jgi:hypothetical protein
MKAESDLTSLIGGATTPRLYAVAPALIGSTFPLVAWHYQDGGTDLNTANLHRVYTTIVVTVKAITASGSYASASAIVDAFDAAIDRKSGTKVLQCVRVGSIPPYAEVDSGVEYRHMGHQYELIVKE